MEKSKIQEIRIDDIDCATIIYDDGSHIHQALQNENGVWFVNMNPSEPFLTSKECFELVKKGYADKTSNLITKDKQGYDYVSPMVHAFAFYNRQKARVERAKFLLEFNDIFDSQKFAILAVDSVNGDVPVLITDNNGKPIISKNKNKLENICKTESSKLKQGKYNENNLLGYTTDRIIKNIYENKHKVTKWNRNPFNVVAIP